MYMVSTRFTSVRFGIVLSQVLEIPAPDSGIARGRCIVYYRQVFSRNRAGGQGDWGTR